MFQLDAIFPPQSVAVVGASTTAGKVGHDIFVNILQGDYQGTLYPVNPRARYVRSVRAYPSISELPEAVDLAIIVLPPKLALSAVEEAAAYVRTRWDFCRNFPRCCFFVWRPLGAMKPIE